MESAGRVREVEKKREKRDKWESDSPSFQTCCHSPAENLLSTLFPHNRIIEKTFERRGMLFSLKSLFKEHKDQNFLFQVN